MLITFARALILYFLVFIVIRIMGKRQIGQLQPFELVVTIMLADLATIPMEDKDIPLVDGVVPILTIMMAEVLLSYISLYWEWGRKLICGKPSILIRNGIIDQTELRRLRYNLNDLLEQMRANGATDISDVEFAILETDGSLSILLKSQKRPVTPADLSIDTDYEGLPLPLVIDGVVNKKNLISAGLSESWLREELAKFGYASPKELFFVVLDTRGNLYYQGKGET
ncbi:MAG: DUF421 domain-containing protein [Limnochordia bacterium]|jgi:uncharacterized membrane protein YcaP (DUF421 family)